MQPNFDVFDHFSKVKVAEIFWGAPIPHPPTFGGVCHPTLPAHQCSTQKHLVALKKLSFGGKKKTNFGHIRHSPLVNTSHSKCSSVTIYIQNLTKLEDLMSHTLGHTFHSKIQPYNYLTKSMASICTKQHYLGQALYIQGCTLKTIH